MHDCVTEKDKKQEKYLKEIQKVESTLFPKMNLEKILWNETMYCQECRNLFRMIIRTFLFLTAKIEKNIVNSRLLCVYSYNYRNDHDIYWKKIKEDAGIHDDITIFKRVKQIDLLSTVKKFKWFCIAYRELRNIDDNKDRCYLALQMTRRKWTFEEIKKLKLYPAMVMCFFDSSPDENVIMQYFKQLGAITITNQHGQSLFQSWKFDRVNQSQILNFKCDYYLAKGSMQVQQFIKAGFDEKKIIIVGIVGEINDGAKHQNTNCFGVFLDSPALPFADSSNVKMIQIANEIAEITSMNYFIKTHPTEKEGRYDQLVNNKCLKIYGKTSKLQEVFKNIEFGIIHASATYVDSYFYGLRCFRLKTNVYYPISYMEDEFTLVKEFVSKIEEWRALTEKKQDEYIKYVRSLYNSGWHEGEIKSALQRIDKEVNEKK